MKKRNVFYDIVKALGILLVVVGHVIPCCRESFPIWIGNLIVGVNMPLFFLISGYFCWKTIEEGDIRRLVRHVKSYLVPAFTISLVLSFLLPFFGLASSNVIGLIYKGVKLFVFGPWFVWSLANCYIVAFAIGRLVQRTDYLLFIAMAIAEIMLLFVPSFGGVVYKTYERSMFPYFIVGGALWHYGWKPWENWCVGATCLITFLIYVFALNAPCREVGMSFYFNETSWRAFLSLRETLCMFARPTVGVVGSIGVMWLVYEVCRQRLVETRLGWLVSTVSKIGMCTLGIYLLHQWILGRIGELTPSLLSTRLGAIGVAVGLTLFCFAVTWVTQEKCGLTRKWLWGK